MPRTCGASLLSNQTAILLAGLTLFAIVPARSALKVARAAVAAPPPMQRESIGLVVVAVLIDALIASLTLLRRRCLLCTSYKRRQPIDVAASVVHSLLLAWALDVDLRLVILLLRKRLCITRQ